MGALQNLYRLANCNAGKYMISTLFPNYYSDQSLLVFKFILMCIALYLYTGTAQQQGDIRLMNGSASSNYAGRLEIYDSSAEKWGTICIEGFTMYSANTACKQLGFARAESFSLAQMMG